MLCIKVLWTFKLFLTSWSQIIYLLFNRQWKWCILCLLDTFVLGLTMTSKFPLPTHTAFDHLKRHIAKATITVINPFLPLVTETDTSDCAIATSLRQSGQTIAFFPRPLSQSEWWHPVIAKDAYTIVKALRKWWHYLIGLHFRLITDQKFVSLI